MRLFRSLGILIHTLIYLAIGGALISLALNLFSIGDVTSIVNYAYTDANAKLGFMITGALLVLFGLVTAHISLSRMQTEKTIAFENPEGQVTVSLSAIEDFIKKSVRHLSEVKELRSSVTASKKGINIVCKATIFADSNIPETTERLQAIIKSKVHDMLGVEETINIKVNVTKISSKGKQDAPPKEQPKEDEEKSRRMPFGVAE